MNDDFEQQVQRIARRFPYPPTPDIKASPRLTRPAPRLRPRYAWALALVVAALGAIIFIEPVRAAVLEILRIGGVEIHIGGATPTPASPPASLLDITGATTLEQAAAAADFPLRLPPDMRAPDYVFVQQWGGPTVIMAWADPAAPDRVTMSLYQMGRGAYAQKLLGESAWVQTQVNGQPAFWTTAPHIVRFDRGGTAREEPAFLVEGHALIWAEGEVTYRLESALPMQDAIALAESLR